MKQENEKSIAADSEVSDQKEVVIDIIEQTFDSSDSVERALFFSTHRT